jgi:hypothetical protein
MVQMLADILEDLDARPDDITVESREVQRQQQVRFGCDQRNDVLARDLVDEQLRGRCVVLSGILTDAYTGTTVAFLRGQTTSDDVQIDHVVALSATWPTGAPALRRPRLGPDGPDPGVGVGTGARPRGPAPAPPAWTTSPADRSRSTGRG